jgi:hypothetical protein
MSLRRDHDERRVLVLDLAVCKRWLADHRARDRLRPAEQPKATAVKPTFTITMQPGPDVGDTIRSLQDHALKRRHGWHVIRIENQNSEKF